MKQCLTYSMDPSPIPLLFGTPNEETGAEYVSAYAMMFPRVQIQPLIGTGTSQIILLDLVQHASTTTPLQHSSLEAQAAVPVFSVDLVNRKWLRLKWSHFTSRGREERISAALRALESAIFPYPLDDETYAWVTRDSDVEDL